MKQFSKFSDAAQLILHVTDNLQSLPRIKMGMKRIMFSATHDDASVSKYYFNGQSVRRQ